MMQKYTSFATKIKTWRTIDKEYLFETVILRRIDDVNNILENEDILTADDIKISSYMDSLVKKGTDEDESAAIAVLLPLQEQGRSSK